MNRQKKFEFIRWAHFVLLFFLVTACIVLLSELVIGPVFQWLLFDIPYIFPTWSRVLRLTCLVLFIGFFVGTVSWYYEKYKSGR